MVRADRAELADAVPVEPGEKAPHRDAIGGPGIRVADIGGEEIDEALRGALAGGGDHRRHRHRPGRGSEDRDLGCLARLVVGHLGLGHRTPSPSVE